MRRFLSRKGRFSLRQSKSGPRGASKDFYLTLPATNQNWPEEFGFTLGGAGPSYILSVVEGSSAYLAGLQPGDQVVDIEGQEVSSLSTQALVALAQTLKTVPPSIGVVSRIEQMDINPGPDGRFGFTIVGDCPLLVDDCLPNSPAGRAGLRAGDYVMEVNGIPVKHHETAAAMIKAAQGRPLRLGVLSMKRRIKRLSHSMREVSLSGDSVRQDRTHKAMEFNKKVEEVLGEEPDVKEQLFGVLKQYAAERNVENLAEALPDILITEDHQQLIDSVRIFIPKKHRERFDEVVSQSLMGRIKGRSFSDPSRSHLRRSRSEDHPERLLVSTRASSVPRTHAEEGMVPPGRGLRKTTSLITGHVNAAPLRRTVRVCKGNLSFGFTLRGHAPVWIDSIIPGSPAEKAGLKPGDRILFLNGLDMRSCSHEKVVSMLQGSGAMPTLVVEEGPPTFTRAEPEQPGGPGRGSPGVGIPRSPVLSSLQWVAEILPPSIRVQGRTFGQQLEHLLTIQERYNICKALENFFQHRNVDTLIVDVFPVLDTPAKQVIWQFVYQLLTYEEQEHCQSKISRFLGYKAAAPAPPPEPELEPAPEPHRRSSSMRVTGTAYRASVRGRSSDDLVIGTHLGMGVRTDTIDTGMRLAPGERQSGDGTSLPETPNNLTNLSAVYAELENVYSGKRSKSLKARAPPPVDSLMELELLQHAGSPSIHANTGSRKGPPPSPSTWQDPFPSPPLPGQYYPPGFTSQTSAESNPYISLDSPPPSPPNYPASPPSQAHLSKRRYTFSHPPHSSDTNRFLDALSEQLGQRVTIADDFLSPENDYEEDVVQMSFPDDEDEDDEEVVVDDEDGDGGFIVPPELSSPSECQSSSGEDASSLTYSSSSEHIPPPPMTPPPPPPVQFNDPLSPSYTATPQLSPKIQLPLRRHHGPPPAPPPRSNQPPKRQSIHKVLPTREDLLAHTAMQEKKAYQEQQILQEQHAFQEQKEFQEQQVFQTQQAYQEQQVQQAYQERQAYQEQQIFQEQQAIQEQKGFQEQQTLQEQQAYQEQKVYQEQQAYKEQQAYQEQQAYEEQQMYQEHQAFQGQQTFQGQQMIQGQQAFQGQQTFKGQQAFQGQQAYKEQQAYQEQHIYQGHQSLPAQPSQSAPHQQKLHQSLPPLPSPEAAPTGKTLYQMHQAQKQSHRQSRRQTQSATSPHNPPACSPVHPDKQNQHSEAIYQSLHHTQSHHSSIELLHQAHQVQQHHSSIELLHQAHHSSMELLHQVHRMQQHHSSTEILHQAHQIHQEQSGSLTAHQDHDIHQACPNYQIQQIQPPPHSCSQGQQTHQPRHSIKSHRTHQQSLQRPHSIQQTYHHTPHIQHIQHQVPLQPTQPELHQIHLIHQPTQQLHHTQPTLSTFQPLPPHQPTLSTFRPLPENLPHQTHHIHPCNQGRPQSQPSQRLLQSQSIHQSSQSHNHPQHYPQPQTQSKQHSQSQNNVDQLGHQEPPPPPPLPSPGTPPPLPQPSLLRMDSNHMSVKRLRWEQVENSEGTIWGQLGEDSDYDKLNDMVKYLDLELHFGTQKNPISSPETAPLSETSRKKDIIQILSYKKAYNASILIAHLKLSPSELRQVLMTMATERLEPAHIKQLLLYAPDAEEVKQYEQYSQDPAKLSEPDQFVLQMLSVPDYKTRLRSLHFKSTLQEKTEEMRVGYDCIYNASTELKYSKKLAKILEFVLAMGNYLNNGQPKTGHKTTGFKINFLTELSTTKTVDGKSTFLHILVKSLCLHFPNVLDFAKDLTTIPLAAKVNQRTITSDLNDLHTTVQDIRSACHKMPATADDRFAAVMSGFLENIHPVLQSLESLQQRAMEEFSKTASFFGEDSQTTNTETFFGIFAEFIAKFERALSDNLANEYPPKSPRSPRLASPLVW